MKKLEIINEQIVLGKQFKIYGTFEEPLFLAKDVANWIEHTNVSKMIEDAELDNVELVKDFIEITYSYGNGFRTRKQESLFLTEDGLYEVLMQSRKPIAKQFKKEVKKILKQIRKTGGYIPTNEEDDNLTIMSKAFLIANKTIEEKEKIIKEKDTTINIMKSENEQLKNELEELEEYKTFKHMINSVDTKDMQLGQFGQWLKSNTNIKTGQKLIFKWCKENNLVKYEYKENYAKDYAINNGWLKNVCEYVDTPYGVIPINKIFVTHKGMLYLGKRLFEEYLNVSI